MKRVLVIVPFPMTDEELGRRKDQLKSVKLGPDIAFDFRPVRVGPANYTSQHDFTLADFSILDAGLDAQAEGYDAVCIDTMSDSGMSALRSLLTIPVIGPGRHAMLVAQMLGEKFSILVMWDRWKPLYAKTLGELGMRDKCASIRSIGVRPDNKALLSGKEDAVFPLLLEAAQRCVDEDGADAIILGSTTMHQAHAYLAERLPVPVINPGPLTYRLAETALRLKLTHSKATYPAPLVPKPDMIRAIGAAGAAKGA
ncbi:aspartate/glutamate racemase family protein [Alsobacter sp. SYSU M60028]|uniref:Aspartate/glutamate racemase family protein n=1 Tax=Alsobacter ponti TaxID=2962936 RepID=A0ABT1LEU4_9HYPH|nr:aspartate/glutamate racemase family protein [Alsobacter ponti]MCP8939456.1 aspartate/glutamate racemase family protein [Alsobacter ponti]